MLALASLGLNLGDSADLELAAWTGQLVSASLSALVGLESSFSAVEEHSWSSMGPKLGLRWSPRVLETC